jgi:hypothetical protein
MAKSLTVRLHSGKMGSKLMTVNSEITRIPKTRHLWKRLRRVMYQRSFKKSSSDKFQLGLKIRELKCTHLLQHHTCHFLDKLSRLVVAQLLKHLLPQKQLTYKTNKTNQ